jgi:outer membrane protein OmpA-like peptidoglycan-associated protein
VINVGKPINSSADDFGYIVNKATKKGYFSSNREGGLGFDDIYSFIENKPLELECKQLAEGIITDLETAKPIEGVEVVAYDESGKMIGKTMSSSEGKYSFSTVSCKTKYNLVVKKEGYDNENNQISIPETSGVTKLNFSIKKTPILILIADKPVSLGDDLAKLLGIKIIRFDLAKSNIRKDAAIELTKVLNFMNENPSIKIDVRSHTDSRSSYQYNMRLSDRRAKSTIQWLISKGISPDRLTGKGYGESQLLNECADGIKCSEAKHQLNRRSEFIIISK